MDINITKKDRNGNDLQLGDTVDVYDWGGEGTKIGTAKLTWCNDKGRVCLEPNLVEDPYDLWTKALPRSEKVIVDGVGT